MGFFEGIMKLLDALLFLPNLILCDFEFWQAYLKVFGLWAGWSLHFFEISGFRLVWIFMYLQEPKISGIFISLKFEETL